MSTEELIHYAVSDIGVIFFMLGTLGLPICGGLLGIWVVRKVIKQVNRP